MTPEELLYRAADNIGKHGFVKSAFGGPGAGYCALGALRSVINEDGSTAPLPDGGADFAVYRRAREMLAAVADPAAGADISHHTIVYWNDMQVRTAQDVINAMHKAARG